MRESGTSNEPAWIEEQTSLFMAATGVEVRFSSPEAPHQRPSPFCDACSAFPSNDGNPHPPCSTWLKHLATTTHRTKRATQVSCPGKLSYLIAPVTKEEALYGFLHTGPVLLSESSFSETDRNTGHEAGEKAPEEFPGLGEPAKAAFQPIPRLEAGQRDGLLFFLELVAQRLGARFHEERRLPAQLDPAEALVRRAEAILCGLYREDISTRDVAEKMHVSKSHLCHAFRNVTGGTLRQHLIELRFTEACRLLKEYPKLSISEVAFAAGFQSLSRFNEQFRARQLPSPGKWRRLSQDS